MNKDSLKTLSEAFNEYKNNIENGKTAFAILYTPSKCHLVMIDKDGKFYDQDGEFLPESVFEARIFNDKAELRWLNGSAGKGNSVIISDISYPEAIQPIKQKYLLWGRSLETNPKTWTRFAEARIGDFFVPIEVKRNDEDEKSGYAQFTAVEYLKKYEDGNVAVVDERLTGISIYEEKNDG